MAGAEGEEKEKATEKILIGHSGTARSAGPGIQKYGLCLHLDSGFASSARSGMLAVSARLSYAVAMSKRLAATVCLVLLGLSLAGCTKCGWLWDQSPRSCHSDAPRM